MNSDSESSNDDLDDLEALMSRTLPRGKGKLKGKIPIVYFTSYIVGHTDVRCLVREDKDERKYKKCQGRRDGRDNRGYKDYKDKGNKSCYIFKEETVNSSNDNEEEVVYVAMKDEFDEDKKTTLISYVSEVIDG